MKNYVKSALDTLEGLGFQLDHKDRELRTDRWRFTHANEPDTVLSLNYRMSEQAARAVVAKARQIVGLATSDGASKPKPKLNARQKAERAAEAKKREAARLAAEATEARHEAVALVARRQAQVGELDRLMRGSDGGSSVATIPATAMFTVEEVADQTGLTDKAILRAVQSGALEAYQCGPVVKIKGADVRAWMGQA